MMHYDVKEVATLDQVDIVAFRNLVDFIKKHNTTTTEYISIVDEADIAGFLSIPFDMGEELTPYKIVEYTVNYMQQNKPSKIIVGYEYKYSDEHGVIYIDGDEMERAKKIKALHDKLVKEVSSQEENNE